MRLEKGFQDESLVLFLFFLAAPANKYALKGICAAGVTTRRGGKVDASWRNRSMLTFKVEAAIKLLHGVMVELARSCASAAPRDHVRPLKRKGI